MRPLRASSPCGKQNLILFKATETGLGWGSQDMFLCAGEGIRDIAYLSLRFFHCWLSV